MLSRALSVAARCVERRKQQLPATMPDTGLLSDPGPLCKSFGISMDGFSSCGTVTQTGKIVMTMPTSRRRFEHLLGNGPKDNIRRCRR